jgi:hypothetical protein
MAVGITMHRHTHTYIHTQTHRSESTPAYQQLVHSQQMHAGMTVRTTIHTIAGTCAHGGVPHEADLCGGDAHMDSTETHACACSTHGSGPAHGRLMDRDGILDAVKRDDYKTIRCVSCVCVCGWVGG